MLLYLIFSLTTSICSSLILSQSPLTTGLFILFIAIFLANLYAFFISSWFAFLIFLIYIGGILVIFSYFVALTPNQAKITFNPLILILPVAIFLFVANQTHLTTTFSSHLIFFLYWPRNTTILLLLSLLLLLTIIIIVKITRLFKGPLRPFTSPYVKTFTNHPPFN